MKILIVSDTHGHETELNIVINKTRPFDYLIHCGDTEGHEGRIREMAACPCTIVKGNNDFFSDLEKKRKSLSADTGSWLSTGISTASP
jgi:predicted phosphodiesterase